MRDWSECSGVEHSSEKVSGAWLFKGTRTPVAALFENLKERASVDDFLTWFLGVSREQAIAVLVHVRRSLSDA